MNLSKDSIASHHFSKKLMGGLDEFEVRDFLHILAEEIRHLTQLSKDQNKKLMGQEELIKDYRDREHILKQSISSAQEISDRIRRDAENQSQLILDRAQDKSDSLIQEARHSLQSVYNDIADLKRLHLQFKTSLKASLQAQLEFLEQGPLFASSLPYSGTEMLEDKKLPIDESTQDESTQAESTQAELTEDADTSEDFSPDEDLRALKSSLQSLDKNFS